MRHRIYRSPKAGRYGGQPPTHRDPIARLLPWFKPAVTRNRTKYSRRRRQAQRLRQDAKVRNSPLSDTLAVTPLSTVTVGAPGARLRASLRMAGSSLRCAKRAPCAFTETAVKRAIRAVRAAGETPGRIVVTKDGFAIELAADGPAIVADLDHTPEDDDLWAKKLLG